MFEKVKEIMLESVGCDAEAIVPAAKLKEDLEIDSLDAVELNMALEEAFGLSISDEQLAQFITVQDIVTYLEKNV